MTQIGTSRNKLLCRAEKSTPVCRSPNSLHASHQRDSQKKAPLSLIIADIHKKNPSIISLTSWQRTHLTDATKATQTVVSQLPRSLFDSTPANSIPISGFPERRRRRGGGRCLHNQQHPRVASAYPRIHLFSDWTPCMIKQMQESQ